MFVCENNVFTQTADGACLNVPFCVAAARVVSRFPDIVTARAGQSFELQCDGVGPPVQVYWTKGSVRLSDGTGTLRIHNVTERDNGEYYCHAVNYLGRQVKGTKIGTEPTHTNVRILLNSHGVLCCSCDEARV